MTEHHFTGNDGTSCAMGGVWGKNNFAIMWAKSSGCVTENIYKMISHEIGHTLGLEEAFYDSDLFTPAEMGDRTRGEALKKGFSESNYMDYSISAKTLTRKMFFKTQIQRMLLRF